MMNRRRIFSWTLTLGASLLVLASCVTTTNPPPPPLPTIGSFTASPANIAAGAESTLSWVVQNADTVVIEANGTSVHESNQPSGSVAVLPDETTVYHLTATNAQGEAEAQTTVTVLVVVEGPTIFFFEADPTFLPLGGGLSATLTWETAGASSIVVEEVGGEVVYEGVDLNHSIDVTPEETTTYRLTAAGEGGETDTADITITMGEVPPATINGLVATVVAGSQVTLTWTAENATGFEVHAVGGDPEVAELIATPVGSPVTVPIPASERQTLRVVALGAGGNDEAEAVPANVVVNALDYDPYYALGFVPETPIPGSLRYVITNAAPGSVIGFASDITNIALEGVDLQSGVDGHLMLRNDVTISGPVDSRVTLRGWYNEDARPEILDPFTYRSRVLWVGAGVEATLENLILTDGTFIFKGAIIFNGGTLTVRNSYIQNGRAWEAGGGIFNAASGDLTLIDSFVVDNDAFTTDEEDGSPLIIRDIEQVDQSFTYMGYGGGLFNDGGTVTAINTVFDGNTARFHGGSIYIGGGSVTLDESPIRDSVASFTLHTPTADGSEPNYGGGVAVAMAEPERALPSGSLAISGAEVSGNSALWEGGGLFLWPGTSATLTNVAITTNQADYGGGISHHHAFEEVDNLQLVGTTESSFSGNLATADSSTNNIARFCEGLGCPVPPGALGASSALHNVGLATPYFPSTIPLHNR